MVTHLAPLAFVITAGLSGIISFSVSERTQELGICDGDRPMVALRTGLPFRAGDTSESPSGIWRRSSGANSRLARRPI